MPDAYASALAALGIKPQITPMSSVLPGTLPSTASSFDQAMGKLNLVGQSNGAETYKAPTGAPTNPLSFVAGMIGNIPGDISEMVGGLTSLAKSAVHDIAGGVVQAIPGEQGAFERSIEQGGYDFGADFWSAAGHMIQQDYASRYGVHGLGEMANQVYENPLSYLLDALMVGQAASKGAMIGMKAGILSEETAGRILGLGADETSVMNMALKGGAPVSHMTPGIPVVDIMSPTAGGEILYKTSFNPVKRAIQETIINKVLTRSAETARGYFEQGAAATRPTLPGGRVGSAVGAFMETSGYKKLGLAVGEDATAAGNAEGLLMQVESALTQASSEGTRVLRPFIAKSGFNPYSPARLARSMFGIHQADFYQGRNIAFGELKDILQRGLAKQAELGVEGKQAYGNVVNALQFSDQNLNLVANGVLVPVPSGMPKTGPIQANLQGLPVLDQAPKVSYYAGNVQKGAAEVALGNPQTYEKLLGSFGSDVIEHMDDLSPHTPYRAPLAGRNAFRFMVSHPDDAALKIPEIEQALGGTFRGFVDYLNRQDWYKGLHGFFDTPEGVVDINFTTPMLKQAQFMAGNVTKSLLDMQGLVESLSKQAKRLTMEIEDLKGAGQLDLAAKSEKALVKIQESALKLQDNVTAASMYAKEAFRGPMRALNNPTGYDPVLETVDELMLWQYRYGMRPFIDDYLRTNPRWWETPGKQGPYTVAANRAVSTLKIELFEGRLAKFQTDVEKLIRGRGGYDKATLDEDLYQLMVEHGFTKDAFNSKGGIEDIVAESALRDFWDGYKGGWRRLSKGGEPAITDAAKYIRDRVREYAWPKALNGELKGWDWQTFHGSVAQMPIYYPHLRTSKLKNSDFLANKLPPETLANFKSTTPAFSKEWRGMNWLQGAASMDPWEVYSRMAASYLRHEELVDAMERMKTFGRQMTYDQMVEFERTGYRNEMLWSPDWNVSKIREHQMFMDDMADSMRNDGKTFADASADAMTKLRERIRNPDELKQLDNITVYAIPKHVADQATKTIFRGFAPGALRMWWDAPMNLWRATVLGLNPRWLVYNMMGNIVFTGIENPMALRRLFGAWDKQDQAYINGVMDAIHVRGMSARSLTQRGFVTSESAKLKQNWGAAAERYPGWTDFATAISDSKFNLFARASRRLRGMNATVEQVARQGLFIDEFGRARLEGISRIFESNMDIVKRLARDGVSEHGMDRMLAAANRTLGDYTTLSSLERDVFRRFLLPFYPFYRHVTKFTLRMPWNHPLKSQVFRYMEELDKQMSPLLPDYLQGAFFLGDLQGKDAYWNISNFNPLQGFGPNANAIGLVNPLIKAGIQTITGVNDFGVPYESPDVYEAGNGMKFTKDEHGNWVPFEGVQHPPYWKALASQFGTPLTYLNLPGYKNPTELTRALSQLGLSINRFDTQKYRTNTLEGEIEALLYGGQP